MANQGFCLLLCALLTIVPCAMATPDPNTITRVHVMLANHLDVGFALSSSGIPGAVPPYVSEVANLYFHHHIPKMISNGQYMRSLGKPYHYTTHAWLVHGFLYCAQIAWPKINSNYTVQCPNASSISSLRAAIQNGDITWHAFPFNNQIGTMSAVMIDQTLKYVHALDDEFGLPHKTVVSQRDVPGIPASAIPVFLKNGIRAVNVGVNGASAPPAVPRVFRWQHPYNNSDEIFGMWNPGGYGEYTIPECSYVDGWGTAMCYYWRYDNDGPGNTTMLIKVLNTVQQQFPNAKVFASTFDAYINELVTVKQRLPIVAAEMGDTWIHGPSSDPYKLRLWRSLSRSVENFIAQGNWTINVPTRNLLHLILKSPEHTWGWDFKTWLNDTVNWDNAGFQQALKDPVWGPKYQRLMSAWIEQRMYTIAPFKLLGLKLPPPVEKTVRRNAGRRQLTPQCPWQIKFGPKGDIISLVNVWDNRTWFDPQHTIHFSHTTYTSDDIRNYWLNYGLCGPNASNCQPWFQGDFGKPGLENVTTVHGDFTPQLVNTAQVGQCQVRATLSMQPNLYGPPQNIIIDVDLNHRQMLKILVTTVNKTSSRMPEALWYSFKPLADSLNGRWSIDVAGTPTPVDNTVLNGTRHFLATWGGVSYTSPKTKFEIRPIDSGTVGFGPVNPFPTPLSQYGDPAQGVHFNLYNNIWSTNYILWYPYMPGEVDNSFAFEFHVRP